jgi:hypothetical protein
MSIPAFGVARWLNKFRVRPNTFASLSAGRWDSFRQKGLIRCFGIFPHHEPCPRPPHTPLLPKHGDKMHTVGLLLVTL